MRPHLLTASWPTWIRGTAAAATLLLGTAARAEAGPPQLWMAWNSCQPLYAWDLFLGNAPTRIPTAVVGGGERR